MKKEVNNKYYVSWSDIDTFIKNVSIDESIEAIVAIHRGGLTLGTMLSHKFNLPLVILHDSTTHKNKVPTDIDKVKEVIKRFKSIMLVDDISDTGTTLNRILEGLEVGEQDNWILTYAIKVSTTCLPEYYKLTVPDTTWVVFPWEVGEKK